MSQDSSRACCSRKTCSTSDSDCTGRLLDTSRGSSHQLVHVQHRAQLDRAAPSAGDPARPCDRHVEIRAFEDEVAADLFLRLGEGAVRQKRLLLAHAHSRRRRRSVKRITADEHSLASRLSREITVLRSFLAVDGLVGIPFGPDGCHVLHAGLLPNDADAVVRKVDDQRTTALSAQSRIGAAYVWAAKPTRWPCASARTPKVTPGTLVAGCTVLPPSSSARPSVAATSATPTKNSTVSLPPCSGPMPPGMASGTPVST